MAQTLTRKEMRDRIRHRLGLWTSTDWAESIQDPSQAVVGEPHPAQMDPTNAHINEALEETISDVNVRARLGGMDEAVSVSIPAQTANGPYRVDLATLYYPRDAQVNEVKRVWYADSSGTTTHLRFTSFRDLDAQGVNFSETAPGSPEQVWISNYGLFVYPAPSSAITLYAYVGRALLGPATDDDTIPQLPADLFPVVLDGAAWRLAGEPSADAVLAAKEQALGQRYAAGVEKLKMAIGSMGQYAGRFVAQSYRTRRGSR